MWSTAAGLVARALSLVGTVLLVRFLAPAEYGEVQAASVLVLTAGQIATLGVGAYIISFPKSGRAVAFHATVIHVGLGVLAMAALWPLRHHLGPLFDASNVSQFIPGLMLSLVLDRMSYMAERPVVRDLGFRKVSVSRTLGEVTYTGVSVFFAWRGHGAMSVVYGNVARSVVQACSCCCPARTGASGPCPRGWSARRCRRLIPYGAVVAIESVAEFGSRKWDNLLVARTVRPGGGRAVRHGLQPGRPAIDPDRRADRRRAAGVVRPHRARETPGSRAARGHLDGVDHGAAVDRAGRGGADRRPGVFSTRSGR